MNTPSKRERESKKARKKREKAERRREKREMGAGDVPVTGRDDEGLDPTPSVEQIMANMEGPATQGGSSIPLKLFVGSLSYDTDSQGLRAAFEQFGPVEDAVVITDRGTGESRGFGFVTMADRRDGNRAIQEMDGAELDGRRIAVNVATDRR
ncbi:MAG: RNA recognition motif domain-containing protein [Myxococcota bacterium]